MPFISLCSFKHFVLSEALSLPPSAQDNWQGMQRNVLEVYSAFSKAIEIAFLSGLSLYALDEVGDSNPTSKTVKSWDQMQLKPLKALLFKLNNDLGEDGSDLFLVQKLLPWYALMQKYDVGKLLGQGNFAKVYHARNLETGQSVAIKVFDKEKLVKVGMIEQTKREISVMKLVKHPNVVELFEVMATKSKIYFVMEFAKGGELFKKIAKVGRFKEDQAGKYFLQLINAVDYCHSRGVYHRDLKPENLLMDENGDLKVSDFGLSALVESRNQDVLLQTACGTPAYVAPEVVCRKGYDGAKADIWSCGVILFVLLAGYLPFHDSNLMEMYKKIGKAEYKCPNWFSYEARKLLSKILNPNPNKRISIARIMENSWFRKGFNSQAIRSRTEAEEVAPIDNVVLASGHCENSDSNTSEATQELAKPTTLNAFDIISLSTGFDLSGLFTENDEKKVVQFTSTHPASSIMSKFEDLARHLKLKVMKKDRGSLKMEGSKEGRKRPISIQADIYEFTPSFHLVEVKKLSGDTLEYKRVLEKDIRLALKDIVWAWQGEQNQLQL